MKNILKELKELTYQKKIYLIKEKLNLIDKLIKGKIFEEYLEFLFEGNGYIATINGCLLYTSIEAGAWITMKDKVVRNNLTLTVNGEEIFNDIVSVNGFPTTAGQFGYRTWFDNKTVNVDYLKINEIVAPIEVKEVKEVNISTLVNSKPELPYKVNVTYDDGTAGEEVVIWDYMDPYDYAQEGTFTVNGLSLIHI